MWSTRVFLESSNIIFKSPIVLKYFAIIVIFCHQSLGTSIESLGGLNNSQIVGNAEDNNSQFARTLFWVSPLINFDIFLYTISFALIPAAILWVYWLYPPGKFYSSAPPAPDYIGFSVMNLTRRDISERRTI